MYRHTRLAAVIVAGAVLIAGGTVNAAAAAAPSGAPRTLTFFAFDINNGTSEPGFIPVAGTNPSVFAQGDELIINDQITTPHKVGVAATAVRVLAITGGTAGHDGAAGTLHVAFTASHKILTFDLK